MSKDVYVEAAHVLSAKLGIAFDEAMILVRVRNWQKMGDRRMGPLAEKMVEDGWVNEVFVTSSGTDISDIQHMFQKGYLQPRQVLSDNVITSYNHRWMRVTDEVEREIQNAIAGIDKPALRGAELL